MAALAEPSNQVLVSDLSFWEMILKAQAGKPMFSGSIPAFKDRLQLNAITRLPVSIDHILRVEGLPMFHRDPFDRLLIAQAIVEGAAIVSADGIIGQYPVPVLW